MKPTSVPDDVARAAVELFAAQGYANTSVQQIVDAAGVTKGAMYHYFASKDDLLFGIYDRMLSLQERRLDEIAATGGPALEVLRAACIDVIDTSIAHLAEGTVFFQSIHLLSDERRREVTRRRRVYNDVFATVLVRCQAEGSCRTDIPLPVLIANFFSDVHYLAQWYSTDGAETAQEVAAQLTDLFVKGIAPS